MKKQVLCLVLSGLLAAVPMTGRIFCADVFAEENGSDAEQGVPEEDTDAEDAETDDAEAEDADAENAEAEDALYFETTDIDGNTVKSDELFAEHEITMVNVWTSWCGPCINELPELEKLNEEFQEKDAVIVGLLYDGSEEGAVEDARDILEETGVTYLILLPWDTMEEDLDIQAFPTTFFINQKGEVVGDRIIGAMVDLYPSALDELL